MLFFFSRFALGFQHWPVPALSIVNYYFLLMIFLIAFAILVKERYFPYIYAYISIMALAYLSGFLVMFIGEKFAFGDNDLMYKAWEYRKAAVHLSIFLSMAHITICQIARSFRKIYRIAMSLGLGVLATFLFFNFPLFGSGQFDHEMLIRQLLRACIAMNGLTIGLIGVYGLSYYYQAKPFSSHINLIVAGFFFFLLIDTNDNYFMLLRGTTPAISQFFLLINLIFFVLVLAHKLYFMQSPYGNFWETVISEKNKSKYDIILKISVVEKKIYAFASRFEKGYHRVLSLILIAVAIALLIIYFPYEYTARAIIAIVLFLAFLFAYTFYLVKKKTNYKFKIKRKGIDKN